MSQSIAPQQTHENYIDGLRGLAMAAIVYHHANNYFKPNYYLTFSPQIVEGLFLSINLFFVVSAFTIFNSSVRRFSVDRYPKTSFYIRRAFRILPWWWLNVIFMAILRKASLKMFLFNAFFLFGFSSDLSQRLVPGSWSLFVEEIFYVFFPFIFLLFNGMRNFHRLAIALIAMVMLRIFWVHFMTTQGLGSYEQSWGSPFANLQWFFVGMLLYYFVETLKKSESMRSMVAKSVKWLDGIVLIGLAVTSITDITFHVLVVTLIFISGLVPGGLLYRLIHSKPLREIGIRCYSLYFLHFYALDGMSPYKDQIFEAAGISTWPTELQIALYGSAVLAVCFPISWMTFKFVERPCVLLGARVVRKLNS